MTIATLAQAEAWLEGLINVERLRDQRRARLSLGPIRALLTQLGNPEAGLRVIHLAGSKGKGSTALLAEALLRAAGLSVGTFTSPHLERWTERFRLDGEPVPGGRLAKAVARLRGPVEAQRAAGGAVSFFDATTAAALLLFAEARVDVAILEVGLGGRLDSTNAVAPAVCAITSIELEHCEKLGDSVAAIAAEKVGIAKAGVPLVVGALPAEAEAVVMAQAHARGCKPARLGRELRVTLLEEGPLASRFRLEDGPLHLEARLNWPGAHQVRNAALALACVRRLGVVDVAKLASLAREAFASVVLPGRVEVLGRAPWRVVDAAHTAQSAAALAQVLARLPHRRGHMVVSISAGKDTTAICQALEPLLDEVTLTRAEATRSLDPAELARAVHAAAPDAQLRIQADPRRALREARAALGAEDLLCATGSVYLAGIARNVLAGGDD